MTWIASLHGDASQLGADAAAAEAKVRDAIAALAGQLVPDGHVGVAATFHGTTTGDVNLLQPGAPVDAGPPVTGVPVIALVGDEPLPPPSNNADDQPQSALPPESAPLVESADAPDASEPPS